MNDSPKSEPSFEHSLAELEVIVHELEEGQLGLADALARYEQGVKHLKHCYQLLQQAERKIELLTGANDDGTAITQPMADGAEPLAESAGRRRRTKPASSPPASEQRDIDAQGHST
jgi:exodeoxyribonuclease VII small subunit